MTITLIFIVITHPVSIRLLILTNSILVVLLIGLRFKNIWFSYILFLVIVGGLLILFLYITNTASNEKFKISKPLILIILTSLIIWIYTITINKFLLYNEFIINEKTPNLELTIIKFFLIPRNPIIFLIIIYLLITIIISVKITDINKGPLRNIK